MTDTDLPEVDTVLDTQGLLCPEPVMLLHGKVREMAEGEIVQVLATDPSTTRDIPKFCHFLEHELLAEYHTDERYEYYIKKSGGS